MGRLCKGLSVVEVLVIVAVLAVGATLSVTSLQRFATTRALHGAAAENMHALHHARSAAIARQEAVAVSVLSAQGGGRCQIVHTGSAQDCQCTQPQIASCREPSELLRASHHAARSLVLVSSSVASVRFDARAGTATPAGRFVLRSRDGREIQNVVSLTGRVRSCANSNQEPGYGRCTS